jgi:hypothetical protein
MIDWENGKFTHARFASSKKDLIEAIWMDYEVSEEIGTPFQALGIPCDLEDEAYVKLLETFTTDEISTMTDQWAKEEEENFKLFVKEMALDYGLVYDPNAADRQAGHSVDHIFTPPEGDEGTDLLFNVKLKIFDMDQVINSDDEDLKKELREADTPLKALYVAGKFLFE